MTLNDSSGSPVNNANVEILIGPKSDDHTASESGHEAPEAAPAHGAEQGHSSMPGMEINEPATETHEMSTHEEKENTLPLEELSEQGMYVVETHLEAAGIHEVNVMFHVNGEMLQADFVVEIPGVHSKTIVLWSFVAINVVLITSASIPQTTSYPCERPIST